jgi:hypothetical protein
MGKKRGLKKWKNQKGGKKTEKRGKIIRKRRKNQKNEEMVFYQRYIKY